MAIRWEEVAKVHGTQAGVRVQNGRVTSLLVSVKRDEPYTNQVSGNEIRYHIRRQGQGKRWAELLQRAQTAQESVRVFRKLAVNSWEDLGDYRVFADKDSKGPDVYFTLRKK